MINFKKLKSQIKPFKPEAKHKGYIFIATDEQIANGGFTVAKVGSKRSLIDVWHSTSRKNRMYGQI